jgi:MOSC domain-containing protein YiiM
MKLLSVNVSLPEEVPHERETVSTGIFKDPVDGRVMLRAMNLDGDGQADLENHGGVYQAAYVYSVENYDHWRHELGWDRSRLRPVWGELYGRGDGGRPHLYR